MKINKKMIKSMLFNLSKTKDFTPKLKIGNETKELVQEIKLLGVKITNDMKWMYKPGQTDLASQPYHT